MIAQGAPLFRFRFFFGVFSTETINSDANSSAAWGSERLFPDPSDTPLEAIFGAARRARRNHKSITDHGLCENMKIVSLAMRSGPRASVSPPLNRLDHHFFRGLVGNHVHHAGEVPIHAGTAVEFVHDSVG